MADCVLNDGRLKRIVVAMVERSWKAVRQIAEGASFDEE